MKKHLVLPPYPRNKEEIYHLFFAYCQLICEIPYGMVATEKDLLEVMKKAYSKVRIEIEYPKCISAMHIEEQFPYWRLLSFYGYLHGNKRAQQRLLSKEGHTVILPNPKISKYTVENYKDKQYKFDNLSISVMSSDYDYISNVMEKVYNKLNIQSAT